MASDPASPTKPPVMTLGPPLDNSGHSPRSGSHRNAVRTVPLAARRATPAGRFGVRPRASWARGRPGTRHPAPPGPSRALRVPSTRGGGRARVGCRRGRAPGGPDAPEAGGGGTGRSTRGRAGGAHVTSGRLAQVRGRRALRGAAGARPAGVSGGGPPSPGGDQPAVEGGPPLRTAAIRPRSRLQTRRGPGPRSAPGSPKRERGVAHARVSRGGARGQVRHRACARPRGVFCGTHCATSSR